MSAIAAILLVLATAMLAAGLAYRVALWLAAPVPLSIPTMPAPLTAAARPCGSAAKCCCSKACSAPTSRSGRPRWRSSGPRSRAAAPSSLRGRGAPAWLVAIQPVGRLAGWMMMAGLLFSWRAVSCPPRPHGDADRRYYCSCPAARVMGTSGLVTTYLLHTDILAVKAFLASIWRGRAGRAAAGPDVPAASAAGDPAAGQCAVGGAAARAGLVFSPTRNQPDGSRRYRRPARWARQAGRRRTMSAFEPPPLADEVELAPPPALCTGAHGAQPPLRCGAAHNQALGFPGERGAGLGTARG